MSQKPIQITRKPRRTPTEPSTGQPGGKATPPEARVCPACGAFIGDERRHTEFHAGIDGLLRWAQRVNEVFREELR